MSGRLTMQQRLQAAVQPVVAPQSIPAPITGWNTRDALDAMEPTDAVVLDNWYPNAGGVQIRGGSALFASGMGTGQVQTLAQYDSATAVKFLAGANGHLYDISSGAPTSLGSAFTVNAWQTTNFLSHMFFCNGADTAQIFDGTTLSAATFTGVTLSTLYGVFQYQQRLFFWQKKSTGFWFAPLNSITGALSFYDLSPFTPNGGTLVAVTTISHDGGNGVTNLIVFAMSSGDCLLYLGNDPSLAADWQLIGTYRISPPVSPRAVCQYGADAFMTTFDDHLPLQQQLVALKLGQLPPRSKVSNAVAKAVAANQTGFGWDAVFYPTQRSILFNIPNADGTFDQHVLNTSNNAWTRFVGNNGCCWGLYKNALYFGAANGSVYTADTGFTDLGSAIAADGQQAWNTFDNPERKRLAAIRPIVQSVGIVDYSFGIGFDYGPIPTNDTANSPVVGSPWNTSPWNTSPWSSEMSIDTRWRIGGGSGQAIGFELKVNALQPVQWLRTDLRYETGNAL